jgi:hypothetical protein
MPDDSSTPNDFAMQFVSVHNFRTREVAAYSPPDAQSFVDGHFSSILYAAGVRANNVSVEDIQKINRVATVYNKKGSKVITPNFESVKKLLAEYDDLDMHVEIAPTIANLFQERVVKMRDADAFLKNAAATLRGRGYARASVRLRTHMGNDTRFEKNINDFW